MRNNCDISDILHINKTIFAGAKLRKIRHGLHGFHGFFHFNTKKISKYALIRVIRANNIWWNVKNVLPLQPHFGKSEAFGDVNRP
jgi:hypothetical protein